jgi:hypothetical protein
MRIHVVLVGILMLIPAYAYAAPDIQVFNYSSYINSSGLPVVVGEVVNDGSTSVKAVEVKVNFIGIEGEIIDSGSATAAMDTIPPGQRSPFMVVGSAVGKTVSSYELQIVNFLNSQSKSQMLQIVSSSQSSDGVSELSVRAEVKNVGNEQATGTKVHATFYDYRGNAVAYASTSDTTIEPGGKSAFELKIRERVAIIESYTLSAESDQYSTASFGIQTVNNPLESGSKVRLSRLSVVDQDGNGIGKFAPGERVWIKSDLKNKLLAEQEFTYIVQIKNGDGFPVAINWVDGILTPDMQFSPSISWVPEEEGVYYAEIFVWQSMDNPTPLTSSIRTIILFVKA